HPIVDDSGAVVELIGAAMDVTAAKRAEEALRQAQAELAHVARMATVGELTAWIAHEVNQPLTALTNYARSGQMLIAAGRTAELPAVIEKMLGEAQRAT
ncbi:MAG: PAS domain-containing sensor histidine kinase, partial [Burkholderiales bacterium]